MTAETLAEALEREHREIDEGIAEYVAGLERGSEDASGMRRTMDALRRHIYLEEEFLFPPLNGPGLMMPILVMLREHGELWDLMAELDELIGTGLAPEEIASRCRDLLTRLDSHNTKEETIIYSQADDVLTAAVSGDLQSFIAEGRMPAGWRCSKATT